jgi:hypothetical protein
MTRQTALPGKPNAAGARALARLATGLAAMLILTSCFGDGRLSGGGSGIENPALVLAFTDGNGRPLRATGNLRLFRDGADWKDSSLYSRTLTAQDTAIITSRDLQALPGGIPPLETLPTDSALGFNIVVSGTDQEGLLRGFRLRGSSSRGYTFERSAARGNPFPQVDFPLSPPVLLYTGAIPADQMDKLILIVFVPGSPYFSPVQPDGSMLFPILPKGIHPVQGAALSPFSDSLFTFYCTTDSLDTDRPFNPGKWVPCPGRNLP